MAGQVEPSAMSSRTSSISKARRASAASPPHLAKYSPSTRVGGPSKIGTINFIDEDREEHGPNAFGIHRPLGLRHLFKRPVVRQWIRDEKIYREKREREPSRFELFFDLIFVGILHTLSDNVARYDSTSCLLFVLVFHPAFSVWSDVRAFCNVSGTDDVFQRMFLLFNMLCLLGYLVNISAVTFTSAAVVEHLTEAVILAEEPVAFPEGSVRFPTLRAAMLFIVVAKFARLLLMGVYMRVLPRFRTALAFTAAWTLVGTLCLFPLIFVDNSETVFWALLTTSACVDLFGRFIFILPKIAGSETFRRLVRKKPRPIVSNGITGMRHKDVPCLNIEHHIERQSSFIILVLGEIMLNLTFIAEPGQVGLHDKLGKAFLGVIAAYLLCWCYFDLESHHWLSGMTSTFLHFPFVCAVVLASTALRELVANNEVPTAVTWYWCGGLAVAVCCLGLMSVMHKSLDKNGSGMIPHGGRVLARFILSLIFALLPLSSTMKTSLKVLGTTSGLLVALVTFEVGSKLGVHPCPEKCAEFDGESVEVPLGRDGETEQEAALADALAESNMSPSEVDEKEVGLTDKALSQIDVKLLCERRRRVAELSQFH